MKAAFLGASLFSFSGMYLSSFEFYNHIAALAWMPWILLILNRGPGPGRSRTVALSIFWALLILAGSPEVIVLAAILAAAQAFLRPKEWKRRLAAASLPLGLACLLTAAQLAPAFTMIAQTERKAQSVIWPLELLQLPNLALPDVLGNDREPGHHDFWGWHIFDRHFPLYYSLYMGFGALLLFLFGARRPWDRRRKVLLSAGALFFLLACGRYSPFFFLYRITPFVSSIRYPVKFFLGSVFCLSILAAFGLDEAMTGRAPGRRAVRCLAAVSGLALALFLAFKGHAISLINAFLLIDKDSSLHELGRSIATGLVFLAGYALIFLFLSKARARGPVLGWALMALAVLDPAGHNRGINPTAPASFFDRPPLIDDLKPPVTVYRGEDFFLDRREKSASNIGFLTYYRRTLYPPSAMGDGVKYVFEPDFYGTYPTRYSDLVRRVKRLPPQEQLKVLQYLGCNYFMSDSPIFSEATARRLVVEGFPFYIERITGRPEAPYIVYSARRAATTGERLNIFMSAGFDPYREVVMEKAIALPGTDGGPADRDAQPSGVSVRREIQGRGWYSASLPRQGIAVFPGNYARGWRAWVDGRKADVFEANLFSKGILMPAGEHEVVLRYLPGSFIWGSAVSLATILSLLAGTLVAGFRLRRKARRASP